MAERISKPVLWPPVSTLSGIFVPCLDVGVAVRGDKPITSKQASQSGTESRSALAYHSFTKKKQYPSPGGCSICVRASMKYQQWVSTARRKQYRNHRYPLPGGGLEYFLKSLTPVEYQGTGGG